MRQTPDKYSLNSKTKETNSYKVTSIFNRIALFQQRIDVQGIFKTDVRERKLVDTTEVRNEILERCEAPFATIYRIKYRGVLVSTKHSSTSE